QAAGKRVHGLERGRYLVRVMRKVINDSYFVCSAHDLQPPADAGELAEMRGGLCQTNAACPCGTQCGERVGHIMQPWDFQKHLGGLTGIALLHLKGDAIRRLDW